MLYQILQWTPFPNKFQPMPEYQLQMAEFDLHLNKANYYEHAVKFGDCFLYPLEIAERIIAYWESRKTFAEFQLQKHAQQCVHPTPRQRRSGRTGKQARRG
jgi:hypothetical protein